MQLRDSLFQEIEKDNNFNPVYVNNDYSSPFLDKVRDKSPERVLNVGIAEQNMVTISAGIRSTGQDSLCYSISTFLYSRAHEQIKVDFLAQKIPFFFISMGPGFDYPEDGPSHHCIEENSITFTYPNTKIFNPLTPACISKHYPSRKLIDSSNIIFSILRKPLSEIARDNLNIQFKSTEFGYESKNDNYKYVIISHGYTASECLKNSNYLIENNCKLIVLTDLKSKLMKDLNTEKFIIWSESLIGSGFHSYYSNAILKTYNQPNIYHLGVNPEEMQPYPFYGDRIMQSNRYRYTFNDLKSLLKET